MADVVLEENPSVSGGTSAPGPAARRTARRYALLAAGTVFGLFAVGGRYDIAIAAWIYPVLLVRFVRTGRAWSGLLWAWGANLAAAVFWVWESAVGSGPVVIAGATALSAVQTLPFVADRLLVPRLRPWPATLVFPAAFAGAEFLIVFLSPFGTAYGSLAVTQYGDLPLLQVVSITGSYGVGFLIAWCASTLNLLWSRPPRRDAVVALGTTGGVLAAVLVGGGARLALDSSGGPTVRVAGVSPSRGVTDALQTVLRNVDGGRRGIAAETAPSVTAAMTAVETDLLAATRREAEAGAKIVVWPENAVKIQAGNVPAVVAAAQEQARASKLYLDIGVDVYSTEGPAFGNDESMLIDPAGTVLWTYQKAHPIPGSETFKAGPEKVPSTTTPYGRLANVICYDADFPAMMRGRADIMLVPAHDWKQYGAAHTQKASLRAIEDGYTLVRQDADGQAAVFDDKGRVLTAADYFQSDQQTMVAFVPTHGERTVYSAIGDVFAWLCLAAVAVLAGVAIRRPARRVEDS